MFRGGQKNATSETNTKQLRHIPCYAANVSNTDLRVSISLTDTCRVAFFNDPDKKRFTRRRFSDKVLGCSLVGGSILSRGRRCIHYGY